MLFSAGGTQVKWNRKDGNILASSHLDEVLIWDRRVRSFRLIPITSTHNTNRKAPSPSPASKPTTAKSTASTGPTPADQKS